MNEIEENIKKLKKDLKLKEEFLELLKKYESEKKSANIEIKEINIIDLEIKNKLINSPELEDYFRKFSYEQANRQIVYPITSKSANDYDSNRHLNQILEDFERLKKEIFDKEYLLQQNRFLKKQEDFLEIQKIDIRENEKDRKNLTNFTFVLALGVIAIIIYYLFYTFIQFVSSPTLHIVFVSGIFCSLLIVLLIFVFNSFNLEENLSKLSNQQKGIIGIFIFIFIICLFGLMTIEDKPINFVQDQDVNLLNQINQEIQNTNVLLNTSLKNQEEINNKQFLILNQFNRFKEIIN